MVVAALNVTLVVASRMLNEVKVIAA